MVDNGRFIAIVEGSIGLAVAAGGGVRAPAVAGHGAPGRKRPKLRGPKLRMEPGNFGVPCGDLLMVSED